MSKPAFEGENRDFIETLFIRFQLIANLANKWREN